MHSAVFHNPCELAMTPNYGIKGDHTFGLSETWPPEVKYGGVWLDATVTLALKSRGCLLQIPGPKNPLVASLSFTTLSFLDCWVSADVKKIHEFEYIKKTYICIFTYIYRLGLHNNPYICVGRCVRNEHQNF